MGSLDRGLRLLVAAAIALLYLTGNIGGGTATVLLVLAAVFAATSFLGFCPLYLPFGFSTFKKKEMMPSNATIVDVRTREEFASGHAARSLNIPLNEIEGRIGELRKLPQPIVLCCASGMRSGRATSILKAAGIRCQNGGPWTAVAQSLN